jgi:DNA-binding MarR family transcriptional regulator
MSKKFQMYTKIPNTLIRDTALSAKLSANAKVFLFYFLSKPQNFIFFNFRILKDIGISRPTLKKVTEELQELDIIKKIKLCQHVDGKIQNLINYESTEYLKNLDYTENFTQVPDLLLELDLNSTTKITLCYILSFPKDWKFRNANIAKDLNISETTVKRSLRTLIAQSLIIRHETKITVLRAVFKGEKVKISNKHKTDSASQPIVNTISINQ